MKSNRFSAFWLTSSVKKAMKSASDSVQEQEGSSHRMGWKVTIVTN